MNPEEDLARLRHRLAGLERENGDRMYLVDNRATKAIEETQAAGDKLKQETSAALAARLEQKRRAEAAGGWATESTLGDKVDDDGDFGFEEDEAENERRAGYRAADEPPISFRPPPASQAPPPPPPPPAAPVTPVVVLEERPVGRHRRSAARGDDDDFAETDWLAT
ncbi:hypothetical protein BS329_21470 [Amycolatopsis coloradensis]|uniref:Uncharacterized protein n=1 Tax=Amycolatopsis coloradensis TaxID=76021 RepID=A0A1R0KPA0_9PSEU|nr:hypothetical protein [Amycolatopsis coloradensis]OLZ49025.1 hypothetical protein BS329_21470 [Amycolatopsis coloradensis]